MEIIGIQSPDVNQWWERVEPYIESALEHGIGEYLPEDIRVGCVERKMQLWVIWDKGIRAVVVTQILRYPRKSILLGLLIAGEGFKEWSPMLDEMLEKFGQEKGCHYIELFGRKGWSKVLPKLNYRETVRMYTKDITKEQDHG